MSILRLKSAYGGSLNMKQLVSFVSYIEGFSALFLFAVAMPVKYIGGDPELVSLVGAIPEDCLLHSLACCSSA